MIQAGTRIGAYEIWGRIGGGGMSDVWLAKHTALAAPLIVKTLQSHVASDTDQQYQRMLNEARLMVRVPSHRVVRAIDVFTHEGQALLVQEYVDGIDLEEADTKRRAALGRGLPLGFVCEAVAEAAAGLHAAHQTGVLHRDLKPSNLFTSAELGIKLGDFGIAVARELAQGENRDISGTGPYMSPEALRGEPIDRRADVYGLGATAFQLRYGHPPFSDPRVVLEGVMRPEFPEPEWPEEAAFQQVVATMLAWRTEDRYRDLAGPLRLLRRLAAVLRGPAPATRLTDGALAFAGVQIRCEVGDLSQVSADAIVSPSNPGLRMRAGVGLALRLRGGDELEAEAQAHGSQPLGACLATGPGRLACKHLLHAVSAWEEVSCIGRVTQRALLLAEELGAQTVAMPALGTGTARVNLEAAARSQASALRWHLALGGSHLREVRFVLFDQDKLTRFQEVLEGVLLEDTVETSHDVGRRASRPAAPEERTFVGRKADPA